ncbi:IS1480 transposase, fragment (plasmid) [Aromatoleum aromaticum EbN1]|uniref:IS1480 transposase n=1 Tax=Aromatoleum aromaticum (strain DSM 19018 / LMG 30748 / EbN1) TaxID=76114 RepID=Q5NWG3_AROAE|nr:transposase [Aromatoleum aromaticum]CAI10601.1 IS1480 transposase, fragment [Aromatoleum aromaticum EbN1]
MRKSYPSDISREQFEIIRPLLQSARRKTCPRRVDLNEVFCAVLYLLRSGCQGRMLPERVQSVLCDSGYRGQPFAQGVREILGQGVTVQIAKRREPHAFEVMPKRWIVERSFAWLEKNRRLWKNCERLLNTSLQFIHLAFLARLLKRL